MSQEEKQNFLRETILEKGYDTGKFADFLISKKGEEGADVSVWTMEDLQIVVQEFIKMNQVEEDNTQNVEIPQEPIKQEIKKEEKKGEKKEYKKKVSMFDVMGDSKPKPKPQPPKTENKQPTPKVETSQPSPKVQTKTTTTEKKIDVKPSTNITTPPTPSFTGSESDYGIIISDIKKCRQIDITDFSKVDKLKITISNPEKKEGGFFSKSYMTYLVKTAPVSFTVRRKYSEFTWFRQALQNIYPTNLIPHMPKRTRFGQDTFAESFVAKRSRGLEKFLNYIAQDPLIKVSPIFHDFLLIGAETDFKSRKTVYENLKPITEVQNYITLDGKATIQISQEKENYLENIKDNTQINLNLYKKLNYSFKQLFDEINVVTNRMEEISQIWNNLHKVSLKYFDSNATCEVYKQMAILFKTWTKSLRDQNILLNVDIREHFKLIRKNFGSLKDLISTIDSPKYNYQKNVRNLMNKKDDLFKKSDISKWELDPKEKIDVAKIIKDKAMALKKMCPKDTQISINLKENYGFYLNKIISEYERMRNLNGVLSKENVVNNANKLSQFMGPYHCAIGEMNAALDTALLTKTNDNKCKLKRIPMEDSLLK